MTLEKFKQAKYLREQIDHLNAKKLQVEQMEKREYDDEFTVLRKLAHDRLCQLISSSEEDFKNL